MKTAPKKILVIRNDKLGDFVLALPCFARLKLSLPNTQIHALVPEYTKPIAELCPYIDRIIIDEKKNSKRAFFKSLQLIKKEKYDAVITLFSTTRVGLLVWLSRIPVRIAPATRFPQVFYNYRLKQRRSRSIKPEFKYNLDLVSYLLSLFNIKEITEPAGIYLKNTEDIKRIKNEFMTQNSIQPGNKLVFIHPGCGGSAANLSLEQFALLARSLKFSTGHTFVITAGPGEFELADELAQKIKDLSPILFYSQQGLKYFAHFIQIADLFISGSTGTLHLAGAYNIPTAAFYPRKSCTGSLRWQTLNTEDRRIAFTPPEDAEEADMQKINMIAVSTQINQSIVSYEDHA